MPRVSISRTVRRVGPSEAATVLANSMEDAWEDDVALSNADSCDHDIDSLKESPAPAPMRRRERRRVGPESGSPSADNIKKRREKGRLDLETKITLFKGFEINENDIEQASADASMAETLVKKMASKAAPISAEFITGKGGGDESKQTIFRFYGAHREHRPYFTAYLMFVQTVVTGLMLFVYEVAPVSLHPVTVEQEVYSAFGTPTFVERKAATNLFIGPSHQVLVLLGAHYAPCMRQDERIQVQGRQVQASNEADNMGCCTFRANKQCFNANQSRCLAPQIASWGNASCWSRKCCVNPSEYPHCTWKPLESLEAHETDCTCTVTARPCCHGLLGQCSILTQSECAFRNGHYHHDQVLCGDIDCMQSVCGLNTFAVKDVPDQWHRLLLAPFLSVGLNHLLLLLIAEMLLAFDLEKVIGFWRFGSIFFISIWGGHLISGIFTPYQIQCGSSPGLYGLVACLLIELIQSWKHIHRPRKQFLKMVTISALALVIGILPYIDNFAHVGGFLCGGCAGMAILPWRTMRRWSFARRQCCQIAFTIGLCVLFIVLLTLFFSGQSAECTWCEQLNCLELDDGFCEDTGPSKIPPSVSPTIAWSPRPTSSPTSTPTTAVPTVSPTFSQPSTTPTTRPTTFESTQLCTNNGFTCDQGSGPCWFNSSVISRLYCSDYTENTLDCPSWMTRCAGNPRLPP